MKAYKTMAIYTMLHVLHVSFVLFVHTHTLAFPSTYWAHLWAFFVLKNASFLQQSEYLVCMCAHCLFQSTLFRRVFSTRKFLVQLGRYAKCHRSGIFLFFIRSLLRVHYFRFHFCNSTNCTVAWNMYSWYAVQYVLICLFSAFILLP